MKFNRELLGESLHTALRKGCDSPTANALHKAISKLKDSDWKDYLDVVYRKLLAAPEPKTCGDIAMELTEVRMPRGFANRNARTALFVRHLKALSNDDWYGYASFIWYYVQEDKKPKKVPVAEVTRQINIEYSYHLYDEKGHFFASGGLNASSDAEALASLKQIAEESYFKGVKYSIKKSGFENSDNPLTAALEGAERSLHALLSSAYTMTSNSVAVCKYCLEGSHTAPGKNSMVAMHESDCEAGIAIKALFKAREVLGK
jgi:hypothetical protein